MPASLFLLQEKQSAAVLAICYIGIPLALAAFTVGACGMAVLLGACPQRRVPSRAVHLPLQAAPRLQWVAQHSAPACRQIYAGCLPVRESHRFAPALLQTSLRPAHARPLADEPDRTRWYSQTPFADMWRGITEKNPFYTTSARGLAESALPKVPCRKCPAGALSGIPGST